MTDNIMAEYTVRVVREGDESRLELVIHEDNVITAGEMKTISAYGHPDYAELFQATLETIKNS